MTLASFQFSYNGLVLGDGTAYDVTEVQGLESLPAVRVFDQPRALDHGAWIGTDLAGGRAVSLDVDVLGADDASFRSNVEALLAASVVQPAELPLTYQLPGMAGNRQVNCRPRRRDVLVDFDYAMRHGTIALEFEATDPRIYDATQQSVVLPVGTASGGMSFNATFNLGFGTSSTSGSATLTNAGTFETRPLITIAGPVDNPTIQNVTAGRALTLNLSVNSGDTLVIDTDARTILYYVGGTGAGASRRATLVAGSQWWSLLPGANQVTYSANTVQVGSTATIAFRSAWM